MIGVFDSGYGGLPTMRALTELLPVYDYVYLGDHARAPYGPRSNEEIYQFTLQGVRELFSHGCEVVILACNTAAANALREIQQNVLPAEYPGKRALGILVPTVEQISATEEEGNVIGILATEATVRSGAYTREIQHRRLDLVVHEQACPLLTPLIEQGVPATDILGVARGYIDQLLASGPMNTVLLGCTHYELIGSAIAEMLPDGVKLYEQSGIVASSFRDYLGRHPEIGARLGTEGQRMFLTTGDPDTVSCLGARFFESPTAFVHLDIRPNS